MDPDEVCRLMRRAISMARDAQDANDEEAELDALRDLCHHAEDMDRWLDQGGFLPARWERKRATV